MFKGTRRKPGYSLLGIASYRFIALSELSSEVYDNRANGVGETFQVTR